MIKFSQNSFPIKRGPKTRPMLTLRTRNGTIVLNRMAADMLALVAGGRMSIVQDDTAPENWYIQPNDPEGYKLHDDGHGNMTVRFSALVNTLADFFELRPGGTYRFFVSTEPEYFDGIALHGLLLKSNKWDEPKS